MRDIAYNYLIRMRSYVSLAAFALTTSTFAQVAPDFVRPTPEEDFVGPEIVLEWIVNSRTILYQLKIVEVDDNDEKVPGTAEFFSEFFQQNTEIVDGDKSHRRLIVNAEANPVLGKLGSGRFMIMLTALQVISEGTSVVFYTKGAPDSLITSIDTCDPRDTLFTLDAGDPDDTREFRYTFLYKPTSALGSVPLPSRSQLILGVSDSQLVDQALLGGTSNATAGQLGLVPGVTYDISLRVEDTINAALENGLGRLGVSPPQIGVYVNDLARIIALPDDFTFDYVNDPSVRTVDVPITIQVGDLDTEMLDVEVEIYRENDFFGTDPPMYTQLFTGVQRGMPQTLTLTGLEDNPDGISVFARAITTYNVRLRARDDCGVWGEFSNVDSDLGLGLGPEAGAFTISLNDVPIVQSVTAPPVRSYQGDLTELAIPLTVHATGEVIDPVDLAVNLLDVDLRVLNLMVDNPPPVELTSGFSFTATIRANEPGELVTAIVPTNAPRQIYQFEIQVNDYRVGSGFTPNGTPLDKFASSLQTRLNQPPILDMIIQPRAPDVEVYNFNQPDAPDNVVPFELVLADDWVGDVANTVLSDILNVQFMASAITHDQDFAGFAPLAPMTVSGQMDVTAPGDKNLQITITDGDNLETIDTIGIRVNDQPSFDILSPSIDEVFTFLTPTTQVPFTLSMSDDFYDMLSVDISAPGVVHMESFSDDFTGGLQQVASGMAVTTSGRKTLEFTVTDGNGNFRVKTVDVTMNEPPVIEEIVTPEGSVFDFESPDTIVPFTLQLSDDFTDPLEVRFDLNGDAAADQVENVPTGSEEPVILLFNFNAAMEYTVDVIARDEYGVDSAPMSRAIRLNEAPSVDILDPLEGETLAYDGASSPIVFSVTALDAFSPTVDLEFEITGDDIPDMTVNDFPADGVAVDVDLFFPAAGPVTIEVTAIDGDGRRSRMPAVRNTVLNDRPMVEITQPDQDRRFDIDIEDDLPFNVTFGAIFDDDFNMGGGPAWEWNYNDGTANNTNPPPIDHDYSSPGPQTVDVTVTDDIGAVGSDSVDFVINDIPRPEINSIIPSVFDDVANEYQVELNRPTEFFVIGRNTIRDQAQNLVMTRTLSIGGVDETVTLADGAPPVDGATIHTLQAVETLTFTEVGQVEYTVNVVETFSGDSPVTGTRTIVLQVMQDVEGLNKVRRWTEFE